MKKFTKIAAVLAALVLALSFFAGCKNDDGDGGSSNNNNNSSDNTKFQAVADQAEIKFANGDSITAITQDFYLKYEKNVPDDNYPDVYFDAKVKDERYSCIAKEAPYPAQADSEGFYTINVTPILTDEKFDFGIKINPTELNAKKYWNITVLKTTTREFSANNEISFNNDLSEMTIKFDKSISSIEDSFIFTAKPIPLSQLPETVSSSYGTYVPRIELTLKSHKDKNNTEQNDLNNFPLPELWEYNISYGDFLSISPVVPETFTSWADIIPYCSIIGRTEDTNAEYTLFEVYSTSTNTFALNIDNDSSKRIENGTLNGDTITFTKDSKTYSIKLKSLADSYGTEPGAEITGTDITTPVKAGIAGANLEALLSNWANAKQD